MRPCALFLFTALAAVPVPSLSTPHHAPSAPDSIAFNLERPDTAGFVGFASSIQMDSGGQEHIAYTGSAAGGSEIRYARKLDSGWAIERIPGTLNAGPLDLALDDADQPWVVFAIGSGILAGDHLGPLHLAHRSGAAWTTETLDLRAAYEEPVAVEFDKAGVLHVVFARGAQPATIVHATQGAAGWDFEPVAEEYQGAIGLSLAFDGDGRAHAAWCNPANTLHATRTPQGWVIEALPSAYTVSLAMDANGRPRLISRGESPSGTPLTRYYAFENGAWSVEEVDPSQLAPRSDLRLQMDRDGRPFVAFVGSDRRLSLAWRDGSVWASQVVDPTARVGSPSFALAGGRHPRISYLDLLSWDLGVAAGESPAPPGPFAARAFLAGGARTTPIVDGPGGDLEVRLEPVDLDFAIEDVESESVAMLSNGTGTVSEIGAVATKSIWSGDLDRNGVEELRFRFAGPDLARLFSSILGRCRAEVAVEATLRTGGRVRAPLELTLVNTGRGHVARVSPNPLNPTGTLGFFVTRAGPVRVDVFDASGRMVRTLLNERAAAPGYREVRLTADVAGHPLRSGVHFYRAVTANGEYSGRFVVLK